LCCSHPMSSLRLGRPFVLFDEDGSRRVALPEPADRGRGGPIEAMAVFRLVLYRLFRHLSRCPLQTLGIRRKLEPSRDRAHPFRLAAARWSAVPSCLRGGDRDRSQPLIAPIQYTLLARRSGNPSVMSQPPPSSIVPLRVSPYPGPPDRSTTPRLLLRCARSPRAASGGSRCEHRPRRTGPLMSGLERKRKRSRRRVARPQTLSEIRSCARQT